MKNQLLALALTLISITSFSQWCGHSHIEQDDAVHVEYRQMGLHIDTPERTVWTDKIVPTVVHILYDNDPYGQGSHITTSQVQSVMDHLNLRLAGQIDQVPDTKIQFCLASLGPDGSAINSVQYHDLNDLSNYDGTGTGVYDVYLQAESMWDVDDSQYCNIYVMQWSGQPAGFSSLPPGSIGVWMKTEYFIDPLSDVFIHEIGHWCGLEHTFKDGTFGYSSCEAAAAEEDCETEGDFVCDTPPTPQNAGCFALCPELEPDLSNHMDYTSASCRDHFTIGQVDRMHSQMSSGRSAHLNNQACSPPDFGLAAVGWFDRSVSCSADLIEPTVIIENQLGQEFQYIFEIKMNLVADQDTVYSFEMSDVEIFGEFEQISYDLPPFAAVFGDYELHFEVNVLDPTLDVWPYDDILVTSVSVESYTQLYVNYSYNGPSRVQWKIWEQGNSSSDPFIDCGYGTDCYPFALDTLVELEHCLADGCYDMLWRFTGPESSVLTGCDAGCSITIWTDQGDTILYWDQVGQFPPDAVNGNVNLSFCVEADDIQCDDLNSDLICDDFQGLGCTDILACNWDPLSIAGDPAIYCYYSEPPYDCNGECINDLDGDSICDELEVAGCQEMNACNYDAAATDPADCIYPQLGYDCNGDCIFDQDGDGVCDQFEVAGCQDPSACNFNALATDPLDCEYAEPGYNCDGLLMNGLQDWTVGIIEIDGVDYEIIDRYLYDTTGRRIDPFDRPDSGLYIEVAVLRNGKVMTRKIIKFNQ